MRATSDAWRVLAATPDEQLDVVTGAALVAKDAHPMLEVETLVERVRALGGPLAGRDLASAPLEEQVAAVSTRFRELGFRGNAESYYDPRNSLISDVLDRGLGIPISLSIVWCAIAERAGVRGSGVSFPGHFVVRVDAAGSGGFVLVDAFDEGALLDEPRREALARHTLGAGAAIHPDLLAPASSRAVLVRLLGNLKAIHANRGDHGRALLAIDRMLTLLPRSTRLLRERATVSLRLGAREVARADIAKILELEPKAPDAPALRAQLASLGASPISREAQRLLD